jgi:glucokinase
MKTFQYLESSPFVLAGDIGGTNTTLAIVERISPQDFVVREKIRFSSPELSSIEEGLTKAQEFFSDQLGDLELRGIALSGAGPVQNNICTTSNLSWNIDGVGISRKFGLPTLIMNDFTAICYGIPLLDQQNSNQLIPLPQPNGLVPRQKEFRSNCTIQAVVGAGTGLGIGYLIKDRGHYMAFPSEAGHSDFGAYDQTTREFQQYLVRQFGKNPGVEQYVSGQGITNIHQFLCAKQTKCPLENTQVLALPKDQQAPEISKLSRSNEICGATLELFVQMYARFASTIALTFLPQAGLFLAGGIAAKNKHWFIEDHLFMKFFLENYKDSIRPALIDIPVYIVDDYGISLPGAALGFFALNS